MRNTSWANILKRSHKGFLKSLKYTYRYISFLFKRRSYLAKLNDEALFSACIEGASLGFYRRVEPFVIKLLTRIDDERQVLLFEYLAKIYLKSKRYKKALMVLEQALQKFPKQASLYAWYGKLLNIYGKKEEANRILNHALSLGLKASEIYK